MEVWDTNVIVALGDAIYLQRLHEDKQQFSAPSAYLAGIEAMKDALVRGEEVIIKLSVKEK